MCGAGEAPSTAPGALQAQSWALFFCYTIQRRVGPFLAPEAAPAAATPPRWALNERRAEQHTCLQSPPLTPSPPETPGQSSLVKRLLPDGGTRGRGHGAQLEKKPASPSTIAACSSPPLSPTTWLPTEETDQVWAELPRTGPHAQPMPGKSLLDGWMDG